MKYRVEIEIEVPVNMMPYAVDRAYFREARSGRVLADYDDDEWIEHE